MAFHNTACHVLNVPLEILRTILRTCIYVLGVREAVRLRSVCKAFDRELPAEVYASQAIEYEEGIDLGTLQRSFVASYVTARALADGISKSNLSRRLNRVLDHFHLEPGPDREQAMLKLVDGVLENYGLDRGDVIRLLSTRGRSLLREETFSDDCLHAAALLGVLEPFRQLKREAVILRSKRMRRPTIDALFSESLLLNAVRGGNEELINLVFTAKESAGLLPLEDEAFPILYCAITEQNEKLVHQIIESGHVDVRTLNVRRSPLRRIMASGGSMRLFQILDGVYDFQPADYEIILVHAAAHGHRELVEMCLKKGADVNGYSSQPPPMLNAASSGQTEIVRLLIDKGADQKLYEEHQQPLTHAAMRGHIEIVRILLTAGAVPARNTRFSPLYWAARNAHMQTLELLLDQDMDVVGKDKYYAHAAVMIAACKGYESVLRLLVSRGVDISTTQDIITSAANLDGFRLCPMIEAYCRGHEHIVKVLLELGATPLDPFAESYTGPYWRGFREGRYPRYFGSGVKPSGHRFGHIRVHGSIG